MSAIAPDRFLIAIGTKIEPRIFRTQAEAEKAAEMLAYLSGKETATYRLSDAACVSLWIFGAGATAFQFRVAHLPFRPDGSSWLDKPAEAKP